MGAVMAETFVATEADAVDDGVGKGGCQCKFAGCESSFGVCKY
jgi:hypothetical protein